MKNWNIFQQLKSQLLSSNNYEEYNQLKNHVTQYQEEME
jgi:hypothetical protein